MKKITQFTFILIALFFAACADELENNTKEPAADEQTVEMAFTSSAITYNTAESAEDEVLTLDLVVCKDGVYQYTRPAYTSNYATFRSTLKIDKDLDIYFFANATSLLDDADFMTPEVTTWQEIQQKLILTYTDTIINNKRVLPMWGQLKGAEVSEHRVNNFGTISLLRAVASANVYFKPVAGKGLDFEPVVAYLYYTADQAFTAPQNSNLTLTDGTVTAVKLPEVPQNMKTTQRIEADFTGNTCESLLYMFDNNTTEGVQQQPGNKRTRLVVGGYLNGSNQMTYYPLDFFKTATTQLLEVTRNNQYNLTITSVNSEGWTDPDEAAEQASVNIDYEVISWDKNKDENIVIDGPDYLSVNTKYVTLYKKAGNQNNIHLSGTFTQEDITLSFPDTTNGQTTSLANGIQNNRFKAEISGEGTNLKLTFTALQDYSEANAETNKETLLIKAGRIEFEVYITQVTSPGWDNGGNEDIDF